MKCSPKRVDNPQYARQRKWLHKIADELGVVCFAPSYHGRNGDKNTVLFYTKEDNEKCLQLDKEGVSCTDPDYPRPFWFFENSDRNCVINYDYANFGKIDLRGLDAYERLKATVELAYRKKLLLDYVVPCGGYHSLPEADEMVNNSNRAIITAYWKANGKAYIGTVNGYGNAEGGTKEVLVEYDGRNICNFGCDFIVPKFDEKLDGLIRLWNKCSSAHLVAEIYDRVIAIGGEYLTWR